MSEELWRDIKEYEGLYQVSSHGRVRSLDRIDRRGQHRSSIILLSRINRGYHRIKLCKNGIEKHFQVHRLVLETFVGPCPEGMEGCHNDGIPTHNRLENLRWDTKKNNQADRKLHGTDTTGEENGFSKLKNSQVWFIKKMLFHGISYTKLSKMFGVGRSAIGSINSNKTWNHIKCTPQGSHDKIKNSVKDWVRGENNATAKTNINQVKQIKCLLSVGDISMAEIARRVNVTYNTVYDIKRNKTWSHVTI